MGARDDDLTALVLEGLADPEATWAVGGFGALAEFGRGRTETATPVAGTRLGLVTARGAIALDPAGAIPLAYETGFSGGWSHAVALCLPRPSSPACPAGILTEAGPDTDAVRAQNYGDNRFDLCLPLPQGSFALRTGDPQTLAALRRALGHPALDPAGPVLDLIARRAVDIVLATPLGRIEVFGGAAPDPPGPRAFLAPRILALGRSHAATAPIPEGLMPVATLHPAHPCRNADRRPRAFDVESHARFQTLLRRWGDPDLFALKERLMAGGGLDGADANRRTRNVARVVRMQAESMAASMTRANQSFDDTSR